MATQSIEDYGAFLRNAVTTAGIASVVFLVLAVTLDVGAGITGQWVRLGAVTASILVGFSASRGIDGDLPDVMSLGMVTIFSVLAVTFLQTPLIRLTPASLGVVAEVLPVFVMAVLVDLVTALGIVLVNNQD